MSSDYWTHQINGQRALIQLPDSKGKFFYGKCFIKLFQNFFEDKNEKERRQRLEKSNRDELDLSNLEAVSAGLSPMQRIDLINKKIKPDGR